MGLLVLQFKETKEFVVSPRPDVHVHPLDTYNQKLIVIEPMDCKALDTKQYVKSTVHEHPNGRRYLHCTSGHQKLRKKGPSVSSNQLGQKAFKTHSLHQETGYSHRYKDGMLDTLSSEW